jgi:pyruvate ferredoxin oxidoreductase gamma subunit/2-oxoisovalerate ferredoxin oxidoreductase gamma subunit
MQGRVFYTVGGSGVIITVIDTPHPCFYTRCRNQTLFAALARLRTTRYCGETDKMKEIRFHGRGGQGVVVGSEVLAHAGFLEKKFVQAFPAFGVERRGAPVAAFCRIADTPIFLRNQIYTPHHVIVLDASLLKTVNITQGLRAGGTVLINGKRPPHFYSLLLENAYRICTVDAGAIALANDLGTISNPIVNTAILGAFARSTGLVTIEAVAQAIAATVPTKKEANQSAARQAYASVRQGPRPEGTLDEKGRDRALETPGNPTDKTQFKCRTPSNPAPSQ